MKRSIAKGTPEQFLNLVQNKIAELGGDVEACDKITASSETTYQDTNGVMGEIGDTWTVSELRQYWDAEHLDDPVLSEYDSFESWLEDTTREMIEIDYTSDYDKYSKDWIAQIKNKLASVGVDVNSPEAENYAEAAAELVAWDDNHDVEDWWQETQADSTSMDEIDALPHIEASTNITSSREDDSTYDDRFIHTLIGDIQAEVQGAVESITFDQDDNNLIVTVVYDDKSVREFQVPFEDLHYDFDEIDADVAYVVNAILYDTDTYDESINSATNTCGIPAVPNMDTEITSAVNDIDIINSRTWAGLIKALDEAGYSVDAAYRRSPDQWIQAYKDGKTFDIEVTQYSDGDFEVIPSNIAEVISSDNAVTGSTDEGKEWIEVSSKSVTDSDGMLTDYTWYRNQSGDKHIFMFGDKELYEPDESYADWECDSAEEAQEWFDSYTGFDEDDEYEYDVYGNSQPTVKCDRCGRPLNEMGTCPVCDDGEEDYE